MAIGNPGGSELSSTVTMGIVSAKNRPLAISENGYTMDTIQTDAAINPGNSGGGLFNMSGELIGIVNAKSSGTDVEGLGFAIPINDALSVAEQLLEYGYVRGKVMIGVMFLDATDSAVARYYGLKPGLYVSELVKGYNDKNLKPGDRIIAINGNEVSSYEDVTVVVKASKVGDILTFQLYRDGKLTEAQVEVFEKVPENLESGDVDFDTEHPTYGFETEDEDVYVSPMPEEGIPGYNPFEGTPFEDFFKGWGFGG
jgi:serine protease Do